MNVKGEVNSTYKEKKSYCIVKGQRKTMITADTRETGLMKTFIVVLRDKIISRYILNK